MQPFGAAEGQGLHLLGACQDTQNPSQVSHRAAQIPGAAEHNLVTAFWETKIPEISPQLTFLS